MGLAVVSSGRPVLAHWRFGRDGEPIGRFTAERLAGAIFGCHEVELPGAEVLRAEVSHSVSDRSVEDWIGVRISESRPHSLEYVL